MNDQHNEQDKSGENRGYVGENPCVRPNSHVPEDYLTQQDTAFADALHRMAEGITPDADFAAALEARLRARSITQTTQERQIIVMPRPRHLRSLATIAAAVIVLVVLTLTVPPLRSLAQDLLNLLFNRGTSDTIVYETPMSFDTQPTPIGTNLYIPSTSIEAAEARAGFAIRVPTYLPSGYTLLDADYDPTANQTSLMYMRDGIALVIVQIPAASAYPLNVGASANILTVQIGSSSAQYVEGNWLVNPQIEGTTATVNETYWDNNFSFQQLRWEADGYVFWMMSAAGQRSDLTLDQWVQIAESLR